MEKKDINILTLCKLRESGLCVFLPVDDGKDGVNFRFYNAVGIDNGCPISSLTDYNDNLKIRQGYKEYDIIAVKKMSSCREVLYHVFNNIEPEKWDWERIEPINITINVEVKPENMVDIENLVYLFRESVKDIKINMVKN
jgi:hypothetical protein